MKNLLTVTQAAEEAHMTVPEFEEKTGLKASISNKYTGRSLKMRTALFYSPY